MAILYLNNDFGKDQAEVFAGLFEKLGGKVIHSEGYQPTTTDFRTTFSKIKDLKPDAIFLLSDGEIRDNTLSELQIYNHEIDDQGKNRTLIPIHTVLLHSNVGFMTLKLIADENDGVFTPVTMTTLP